MTSSSRAVTVVTGASTGIGHATAVRQARAGDRVWALVRDPDAAARLRGLAAAEALELIPGICDVTDDASVTDAFDAVLARAGRIDRLVCNAGTYAGATLETHGMDEIQALFDVNVFGALRCIRAVLPGMRMARTGTIVALSSQSSQAILPTWAAYAGSKRALEGALEALAMEVAGLGIRVHVIQPGSTLTAMRGKIRPRENPPGYERMLERYHAVIAADRTASLAPDDVAQAIERVLDDPRAPFRTLVGEDAVRNTARRAAATDEEWTTLFGLASDEAFSAAWTRLGAGSTPARAAAEPPSPGAFPPNQASARVKQANVR